MNKTIELAALLGMDKNGSMTKADLLKLANSLHGKEVETAEVEEEIEEEGNEDCDGEDSGMSDAERNGFPTRIINGRFSR